MTFPSNKLKNPYYFISANGTVYEISTSQDADNCGQHYVTYQTVSVNGDDKILVKKGDKYLDLHGTPTVAEKDAYYPVSTGKLDIEANKEVFPWICVEYKEKPEDRETKKAYFWLDYLIDDGDEFNGTKFVMNQKHAPEGGSYVEFFKEEVLAKIGLYLANGYTEIEIQRNFPDYLLAEQYGENIPENATANITIDGKKAYLVNVTTSSEDESFEMGITEEDMLNAFYKYCDEQVIAYANKLLKKFNKKLKDTVIVSEDTVEDIVEEDEESSDSEGEVTNYYVITLPGRIQNGTLKVAGCDDYSHVPEGTHITVTAIPASGYVIETLSVGGESVSSPYEFDIHDDVMITVSFTSTTHAHEGNEEPDNPINPNPGTLDPLEPSDPRDGSDDGEEEGDGEEARV